MMNGGHLLVECLKAQKVDRVFCVPGESYLAALDGLHNNGPELVVARHEGGAAMMAEADGKMTGRPGVCFVTRGPGATNASSGVHIAKQDSTPMVLFVGQIGRRMRGREAFQEVDYRNMFGSLAKWVEEIDFADRIPEIISHAWHVAMSGRPGPVVLALPEDMLREETQTEPGPYVNVSDPAPCVDAIERTAQLLHASKKPMIVAGGSRWRQEDADLLQQFSEKWNVPVSVSFRRQQLFEPDHPNYAGDIGLGINPYLQKRAAESDALILLGCRFSENPSQGFSLLDIPGRRNGLVHIHPGPEELGRIYVPHIGINSTPGEFLKAAMKQDAGKGWADLCAADHKSFLDWTGSPPKGVGDLTMSHVVAVLRGHLQGDAILTNGAGNYAIWINRFYRFGWGRQLAPTSGSMGYGLPAAVAAAKRFPDRPVIAMAGDGCFQMSGMEFGVACEYGLNVKVIVCDNGMYGTIRMHQERDFPGRRSGTSLQNPDFARWAEAYGAAGYSVSHNDDFENVFSQAMSATGPALIHLKLDARDIAPGKTI